MLCYQISTNKLIAKYLRNINNIAIKIRAYKYCMYLHETYFSFHSLGKIKL